MKRYINLKTGKKITDFFLPTLTYSYLKKISLRRRHISTNVPPALRKTNFSTVFTIKIFLFTNGLFLRYLGNNDSSLKNVRFFNNKYELLCRSHMCELSRIKLKIVNTTTPC